jgi:hypothetical protein
MYVFVTGVLLSAESASKSKLNRPSDTTPPSSTPSFTRCINAELVDDHILLDSSLACIRCQMAELGSKIHVLGDGRDPEGRECWTVTVRTPTGGSAEFKGINPGRPIAEFRTLIETHEGSHQYYILAFPSTLLVLGAEIREVIQG